MMTPLICRAPLLLGSLMAATAVAADGWTENCNAEVRLSNGLSVAYQYYFNRNAIVASQISDKAAVALTESGALLCFDLQTGRITRERFGTPPAMCLTRDAAGDVIAALQDGSISRVHPATLALETIARVPDPPVWIGAYPRPPDVAGIALVILTRKSPESPEGGPATFTVRDLGRNRIHDLSGTRADPNRAFPAMPKPGFSAVLLDSKARLWLGADRGEWGGALSYLDLTNGRVTVVNMYTDPVYGLIELPDGQVWAYGGMLHMGSHDAYITRVDNTEPQSLWRSADSLRQQPASGEPTFPITHIQVGPDGRTLMVLSYSDIFRTDRDLKHWQRVRALRLSYRWGRPDAVGSYPAVRALHVLDWDTPDLLLATTGNGYVRFTGSNETAFAVPGQLAAQSIDRIENSADGTIFVDRLTDAVWQFAGDRWQKHPVFPPTEGKNRANWSRHVLLVDPHARLVTVAVTDDPHEIVVARWKGADAKIFSREPSDGMLWTVFYTPDDRLWHADHGVLRRLTGKRWERVGKSPEDLWRVSLVNLDGPPWILISARDDTLLRFGYRPAVSPTFEKVALRDEQDQPLAVWDGLPWGRDRCLLATNAGLRLYDIPTGRLSAPSFPVPPSNVRRVGRDALCRAWIGGPGLWLSDPATNTLYDLNNLPMIGARDVFALSPDPDHKDGVIASLGNAGIVYLRASPDPPP